MGAEKWIFFIFLPKSFCQNYADYITVCLRSICQEEFAGIDYRFMRCAFDSQNELGRLCDEVIYQNDVAARLEAGGLGPVHKQVPITVTYSDFVKTYRLDLAVGNAAIYELKTEARLAADHDAQLLNYLFLQGGHHGKLVNFRPAQVQSKFINTSLTAQARRELVVDSVRWREVGPESRTLRMSILGMLHDWGGFLELRLYMEALTHFLGGEQKVERMVTMTRNGVPLGNQRFHLVSEDTAFRLTALTEGAEHHEQQLHALLHLSPLRAIQWINLGGHRVQLVTLTK